jgi:hypothetical protein
MKRDITGTRHTKTRESTHTAWGKSKTDLVGEKGAGHRTLAISHPAPKHNAL